MNETRIMRENGLYLFNNGFHIVRSFIVVFLVNFIEILKLLVSHPWDIQ